MTEPAVKVEGLWKRYHKRFGTSTLWGLLGRRERTDDAFWALRDVSFEVTPGECLGIIGPNGSGKSTLLRILSRITTPTRGRVQVNGRVASMLEVGTGFHSELTGRENVYLSGAILGMSRAEICRRFDEIVAFSGVEEFIDVPVKRYSSGMYVRLAFAVAAHIQTDILIVDEVLAVGDLDFQRKCLGKMGEAGKSGRTVLFVSHNMPAVRRLCHRTMMLHQGCMEAVGATDEVVSRYMSANTAGQDAEVALPPAVGGEGGWASRLRLHAEDGTPRTRFPLGAAWCATIEFEVCRAMEHVIAGVGLVTADGIPLATYWSRPRDLPAGRYAVGFRCQLPLAATSLLVSVGLSAQERPFYYAEGVAKVEVCDVAEGEQPLRARGAGILLTSDAPDIRTL